MRRAHDVCVHSRPFARHAEGERGRASEGESEGARERRERERGGRERRERARLIKDMQGLGQALGRARSREGEHGARDLPAALEERCSARGCERRVQLVREEGTRRVQLVREGGKGGRLRQGSPSRGARGAAGRGSPPPAPPPPTRRPSRARARPPRARAGRSTHRAARPQPPRRARRSTPRAPRARPRPAGRARGSRPAPPPRARTAPRASAPAPTAPRARTPRPPATRCQRRPPPPATPQGFVRKVRGSAGAEGDPGLVGCGACSGRGGDSLGPRRRSGEKGGGGEPCECNAAATAPHGRSRRCSTKPATMPSVSRDAVGADAASDEDAPAPEASSPDESPSALSSVSSRRSPTAPCAPRPPSADAAPAASPGCSRAAASPERPRRPAGFRRRGGTAETSRLPPSTRSSEYFVRSRATHLGAPNTRGEPSAPRDGRGRGQGRGGESGGRGRGSAPLLDRVPGLSGHDMDSVGLGVDDAEGVGAPRVVLGRADRRAEERDLLAQVRELSGRRARRSGARPHSPYLRDSGGGAHTCLCGE